MILIASSLEFTKYHKISWIKTNLSPSIPKYHELQLTCSFFYIKFQISLTINLSLPDCICYSPESSYDKNHIFFIKIWRPQELCGDHGEVDYGPEQKDGDATNTVDYEAKQKAANGVANAVDDENQSHGLYSKSTSHETL